MRIAFIGRVPHEKTGSDQFFLDILREIAHVDVFRRESMSASELVSQINARNPDQIIFYQLPPSFSKHLMPLRCKNLVWVPMWDGFSELSFVRRLQYRYYNLRILCFCKKLYDYVTRKKLAAMYAQYFPAPLAHPGPIRDRPPFTFMLWQRDPRIGLEQLAQLVGQENIRKVIYKHDDHHHSAPHSFEVESIIGWVPRETYLRKLDEIDFYIAPRFQEGVGFSFLEALARGRPVIAYDDATMNEYIQDGLNSLLFDQQFKLRSGLTSPAQLQVALQNSMNLGYRRWEASIPTIKNFIAGKS